MLRSDIQSLFDLAVTDSLVDYNADRTWVDVEDGGSAAVVDLVGHASMDGTIHDNIYVLAFVELGQVVVHVDCTVSAETLRKFRASSSFVSLGIGHSL